MIVGLCWYLCAVSVLALIVDSAITVAPGHEGVVRALMAFHGVSAVLFAGLGVYLQRHRTLAIHQSKSAKTIAIGLAVLMTLFLLMTSVG